MLSGEDKRTSDHAAPKTVSEFAPGYEASGFFGVGALKNTPAGQPPARRTCSRR
jgi:hypothetical protein